MSTLSIKELSHPAGEVLKIAAGKTLDLNSQGSVTMPTGSVIQYATANITSPIVLAASTASVLVTINFTPKYSNSKLWVTYQFNNLQKATGATTSTWFSASVKVDGAVAASMNSGAVGYPEGYSDHRYTFSVSGEIPAYSGTKGIELHGNAASVGSAWAVSYQNKPTTLTVMEIAQ